MKTLKEQFYDYFSINENQFFSIEKKYRHNIIKIKLKEYCICIDEWEIDDNLKPIINGDWNKFYKKNFKKSYSYIKPYIDNYKLKLKLEEKLPERSKTALLSPKHKEKVNKI